MNKNYSRDKKSWIDQTEALTVCWLAWEIFAGKDCEETVVVEIFRNVANE